MGEDSLSVRKYEAAIIPVLPPCGRCGLAVVPGRRHFNLYRNRFAPRLGSGQKHRLERRHPGRRPILPRRLERPGLCYQHKRSAKRRSVPQRVRRQNRIAGLEQAPRLPASCCDRSPDAPGFLIPLERRWRSHLQGTGRVGCPRSAFFRGGERRSSLRLPHSLCGSGTSVRSL